MAQTHDVTSLRPNHAPEVRVLARTTDVTAILLDEVRALLARPAPVLGLATGNTFQRFFDAAVAAEGAGSLDLSDCRVTHLDEWVGFSRGTAGGMATEIDERFLRRLVRGVSEFLPVPAGPAEDEALNENHEAALAAWGGVGLQLLGIGGNGHIAFNEPGTPLDRRTHTTALARDTMEANADRFSSQNVWPTRARTLGPATIMDAGRVVLVALGRRKAKPVKTMLDAPIGSACPASCIRRHANALVLLDREAASLLDGPRDSLNSVTVEA